MFDFLQAGRWIILAGIGLIVVGGLVYLVGKLGGHSSLPGTLRYEGSGFTCVFPLLASIILSVVLTLVLNFLARFIITRSKAGLPARRDLSSQGGIP